jgi:hypothetical protein
LAHCFWSRFECASVDSIDDQGGDFLDAAGSQKGALVGFDSHLAIMGGMKFWYAVAVLDDGSGHVVIIANGETETENGVFVCKQMPSSSRIGFSIYGIKRLICDVGIIAW